MKKVNLVDAAGQEIGRYDEKVKELKARVTNLENAMLLHGTFLTVLKRFFDAIPRAAQMRKTIDEKPTGKGQEGPDQKVNDNPGGTD